VDSIGSVPPSMITSKFYGYTGFYAESDTIVPGKGYWIKVNQAGMLLFNNPVLPGRSNHIIISPISDLPPSPPGEPVQNVAKPSEFVLEQAYPNPFNPATTINYALPYSVHVSLTIYNLLGQEVINVVDRDQDAGYKSVRIDMGNLPSGVYVYRLTAGTFSETRKMILAR